MAKNETRASCDAKHREGGFEVRVHLVSSRHVSPLQKHLHCENRAFNDCEHKYQAQKAPTTLLGFGATVKHGPMLDTQTLIMYVYNHVNSEHRVANMKQTHSYHITEKLYTEISWCACLAGVLVLLGLV